MVKIWVDDMRRPPDHTWIWVQNSRTAFFLVLDCALSNVSVQHLALDHDLGVTDGHSDTTRQLVLSMCDNALPWPKHVSVHSSNPVGVEWLEGTIKRYAPEGVLVDSQLWRSEQKPYPNFAGGK